MARLSIVIPTFNSAATLGRCLSSVRSQAVDDIEVIVVDDVATTDATRAIASFYGARVIVSPAGMAESRNQGVAISSGSHLLHIDSDMRLSPSLLSSVLDAFRDHTEALTIREVAAGTGYWVRARKIDKEAVENTGFGRAIRGISRERFEQLGGYDPTLEAGEDLDFHLRTLAIGARIGHVNKAYLLHDERRLTLTSACQKKFRYGRTTGRFDAKHPSGLARNLGYGRRLVRGTLLGLRRDPAAVPGFLALKVGEAAAGFAGRIAAETKGSRSNSLSPLSGSL